MEPKVPASGYINIHSSAEQSSVDGHSKYLPFCSSKIKTV